ncbi:hypothetical protein TWF730_003728 [Orbilia blumenaviensis]|uniref:Uncharacterized protein n=1 Tax=Orbilia blumenaviensis TaxID=1796055 RepID=A0AAV9U656_9PEZI
MAACTPQSSPKSVSSTAHSNNASTFYDSLPIIRPRLFYTSPPSPSPTSPDAYSHHGILIDQLSTLPLWETEDTGNESDTESVDMEGAVEDSTSSASRSTNSFQFPHIGAFDESPRPSFHRAVHCAFSAGSSDAGSITPTGVCLSDGGEGESILDEVRGMIRFKRSMIRLKKSQIRFKKSQILALQEEVDTLEKVYEFAGDGKNYTVECSTN